MWFLNPISTFFEGAGGGGGVKLPLPLPLYLWWENVKHLKLGTDTKYLM